MQTSLHIRGVFILQKIFDWIATGPSVIISVIVFIVGMILLTIIAKIFKKALKKTKLDVSLQGFFIKTTYTIGIILLLICALATAGISTTGLIAGFSAAGAAVALALKDSLANIAGGIVLLITHPFVTGDYIEMGDKEGKVFRIDIFQTVLVTNDNKTVVIPNGLLSSDAVVNYTKQEKRRVDIKIPVSYDSDIEAAKKSVLKAAANQEKVLKDADKPFVRVSEYNDNSVVLDVKVWCKTDDYWDVYYAMTESIRNCFKEDNIEIPYQRIDVCMVNE